MEETTLEPATQSATTPEAQTGGAAPAQSQGDGTGNTAPPNEDGSPAGSQPDANGDLPKWVPRRMGELAAARKAAEERAEAESARATTAAANAEALQAEIDRLRQASGSAAPGTQALPAGVHPNVQELARALATDMTRDQVAQQLQQLNVAQRAQAIEEAGRKEFGEEFDRSVQNLGMAGIANPMFLEAVTNVPNAEKVVRYLGSAENIEEALRIAQLPPLQMGIELMRLSPKAVQKYTKAVSSAPAPIAPIDGTGTSNGGEPDPQDTKAYIEWRNKTARRRVR